MYIEVGGKVFDINHDLNVNTITYGKAYWNINFVYEILKYVWFRVYRSILLRLDLVEWY